MVFGVPICRAEQRRIGGSCRLSAVRIPQQLTVYVSCQVEFRWPPGKPSSAGNSGSWGAFLLVTYSLCKQRKVTRQKGEKNPFNQPQSPRGHSCPPYNYISKEQPFIAISPRAHSTALAQPETTKKPAHRCWLLNVGQHHQPKYKSGFFAQTQPNRNQPYSKQSQWLRFRHHGCRAEHDFTQPRLGTAIGG